MAQGILSRVGIAQSKIIDHSVMFFYIIVGLRLYRFGSILGAFWPPRWLKSIFKFVLERPRADQEYFFSALEASKSAPRGIQDAFSSHQAPQMQSEATLYRI